MSNIIESSDFSFVKLLFFVVLITLIVSGVTFSYFQWQTSDEQSTDVVFSVEQNFMCAADGGGDITTEDVRFAPTDCIDAEYKEKYPDAPARVVNRTLTVMPTLQKNNITISLDLWLDINSIGEGFTNSQNLSYAVTTSPTSCTEGVISSGNFNGKTTGDSVNIFSDIYSSTLVETYYLYIWLDAKETSSSTMNQELYLSLNGNCSNSTGNSSPNAPVLDEGMIPVTIASDGTVTTVSSSDSSWYDYENKVWANVVLVNEMATDGVDGSKSRSYYLNNPGTTVEQSDILAYYVWIPRYSYRIRENVKCSELEDPNFDDYSECYFPVLLSDTEKSDLITWWYSNYISFEGADMSYTLEQATIDINEMLKTGALYYVVEDTSLSASISQVFEGYYNDTGIVLPIDIIDNNIVDSSKARPIDINFEDGLANISTGNAVTTYYTHPAFVWGDKTISGFWAGKFRTSTSNKCSGTLTSCNIVNQEPIILPNVSSLLGQSISNKFQTSLVFSGGTFDSATGEVIFSGSNTYGLSNDTDSHMMKNSEWGSILYLSHSVYGINGKIRENNNNSDITGCGAASEDSYSTSSCEISYNSSLTPQSTTGNITGVFDMAGIRMTYVMGNYNNDVVYSGFTILPSSKYYDLYSSENFTGTSSTNISFCTLETCGGHALHETAAWYGAVASFVTSESPWFRRDAFSFEYGSGKFDRISGFRVTLIVE